MGGLGLTTTMGYRFVFESTAGQNVVALPSHCRVLFQIQLKNLEECLLALVCSFKRVGHCGRDCRPE